MDNFREIAEKVLKGIECGTFILRNGEKMSYGELGINSGLDPVYNPDRLPYARIGMHYYRADGRRCDSIEFADDVIGYISKLNFKGIAERVLSGELEGTFILRNGCTRDSSQLGRNIHGLVGIFPYYIVDVGTLTDSGTSYENTECEYDVVDFIIKDDINQLTNIKDDINQLTNIRECVHKIFKEFKQIENITNQELREGVIEKFSGLLVSIDTLVKNEKK